MNKSLLKNRDFYRINEYFYEIKQKSDQIDKLINSLSGIGDIIIVGGTIRDLLIKGETPRDIDLIIDTGVDLEIIFSEYNNCLKNRFGGYKLKIDNIEFDIWSIDNHWAFKEKILRKNISNLKYSTFLNFDALFYNLSKQQIDSDIFNQCILNNMLEITLNEEFIDLNPSKEINILRMIIIRDEWELILSNKCTNYIAKWIDTSKDYIYDLYEAQLKHYKYEKLSKDKIETLVLKSL